VCCGAATTSEGREERIGKRRDKRKFLVLARIVSTSAIPGAIYML
jgi:hypothetical protein